MTDTQASEYRLKMDYGSDGSYEKIVNPSYIDVRQRERTGVPETAASILDIVVGLAILIAPFVLVTGIIVHFVKKRGRRKPVFMRKY